MFDVFVQFIRLSWHKDLRLKHRSMCFDVSQSIVKSPIILYNCHGMMGNQRWKYNVVSSLSTSMYTLASHVYLYGIHGITYRALTSFHTSEYISVLLICMVTTAH